MSNSLRPDECVNWTTRDSGKKYDKPDLEFASCMIMCIWDFSSRALFQVSGSPCPYCLHCDHVRHDCTMIMMAEHQGGEVKTVLILAPCPARERSQHIWGIGQRMIYQHTRVVPFAGAAPGANACWFIGGVCFSGMLWLQIRFIPRWSFGVYRQHQRRRRSNQRMSKPSEIYIGNRSLNFLRPCKTPVLINIKHESPCLWKKLQFCPKWFRILPKSE